MIIDPEDFVYCLEWSVFSPVLKEISIPFTTQWKVETQFSYKSIFKVHFYGCTSSLPPFTFVSTMGIS